MRIVQAIGNKALWEHEKTLFLASHLAPISCYGKVFQWMEAFDTQGCVVCFNTSELEEEVLKALLVNRVPTTLVVTERFSDTYNVQIKQALKEKRLLILVLQREEGDGKGYIARLRNQWAISHVQHIVCGYINPNGTIFGLLAGQDNITYLVDRKELKAAEKESKPYRWTVAEDKRLLRMFYEDMGIHAIQKAISRPYSTIYIRIKALTMNDEVLKGREFEDFVVAFFDLPHNKKLTLKEWRGDKTLPGVYPENNSGPDLVLEYDGNPFAIECKWRRHMSKDNEKELLPPDRQTVFQQYSQEHSIPVFLLLGIGGLPSDPDSLHFVPLSKIISIESLLRNTIRTADDILEQVLPLQQKPNHILEQRALYANAYRPWSTEDDEKLAQLYNEGKTIAELMAHFQRNRGGIRSRLRKLGLM